MFVVDNKWNLLAHLVQYYKLSLSDYVLEQVNLNQLPDSDQVKTIAKDFALAYFTQDINVRPLYVAPGNECNDVYLEKAWEKFRHFKLKWNPEKISPSEPFELQFELDL